MSLSQIMVTHCLFSHLNILGMELIASEPRPFPVCTCVLKGIIVRGRSPLNTGKAWAQTSREGRRFPAQNCHGRNGFNASCPPKATEPCLGMNAVSCCFAGIFSALEECTCAVIGGEALPCTGKLYCVESTHTGSLLVRRSITNR